MQIKPFFINSNICLEQEDLSSFEKFMTTIAGNTGNSYITYALIKELFGGLVKISHIPNIYEYNFDNTDRDVDYINNNCTNVFLILQDQIRIQESYGLKLPYERIMNFVSKLNKPVIIAGLGANSFEGFDPEFHKKLDPNLIKFLQFLSDHCIEIGVRGYYTQEILHKIGIDNVNAIGCPSFYEMGKSRVINKQKINDLKSILLSCNLPTNTSSLCKIMQDFCEEKIIKSIAFNRIEENFNPDLLDSYYLQKNHIFSSIADWKQYVSQFKFIIGYRVHGSILALNSGVPALCMNGDSRATEMCQLMKIPHNPKLNIQNENEILKIYEKLDYSELNSTYPVLYDNFINFIHKNSLIHYDENNELINFQNYVEQPSLKLYGKDFYGFLDIKLYLNSIFTKNMDVAERINSNITSINNIQTKYINEYRISNEQLNERLASISTIQNDIINEYRISNEQLNFKLQYIEQKLNKPTFIQQIFSVKNENKHKVVRFLGIKIKFRMK